MLFCTYNIHYGVGSDGRYDVARIADTVAEPTSSVCRSRFRLAAERLRRSDCRDCLQAQPLSLVPRRHGVRRQRGGCRWADRQSPSQLRQRRDLALADRLGAGSSPAQDGARRLLRPAARLRRGVDRDAGGTAARLQRASQPCRPAAAAAAGPRPDGHGAECRAHRCDLGQRAGSTFMFQERRPDVSRSAILAGDFNFTPDHPEYPLVCGETSYYGRLGTTMHLPTPGSPPATAKRKWSPFRARAASTMSSSRTTWRRG